MLSLIVQNENAKIDAINYGYIRMNNIFIMYAWGNIDLDFEFGFDNGSVAIGMYNSEEKVKKVFENMIKAEEEQNSIDTIFETGTGSVHCKKFNIFHMPKNEEV